LVVLTHQINFAIKTWQRDRSGEWIKGPRPKRRYFAVSTVEVRDLATLEEALTRLQDCRRSVVIRGEPCLGIDLNYTPRRSKPGRDGAPPTFQERPRRSLLLDVDGLRPDGFAPTDGPAAAAFARSKLPVEFRRASCFWAHTGSAGVRSGIHLRLAFWLERPVGEVELRRWFEGAPVDFSIFQCVQEIFTGAPIFRGGVDPNSERCGVLDDGAEVVAVPDLRPPPPPKRRPRERPVWRRDGPHAALAELCDFVANTPAAGVNRWGGSGRHDALLRAAISSTRFIVGREIAPRDVVAALADAARHSGLSDDREIERHLANGFRLGGLR
jgi:hypothetical protein